MAYTDSNNAPHSTNRLHGPYYNLKHDPQPHSLDPQPPPPQAPPPPSFQAFSVQQPQPLPPQNFNFRRTRPLAFCCAILCAVFTVIFFVMGSSLLLVYIIYHPRVPTLSVQDLKLYQLNVTRPATNITSAEFASGYSYVNSSMLIEVQAFNPNKKLGVYYMYMNASVYYMNDLLVSQSIAPFSQGKRNVTTLPLTLQFGRLISKEVGASIETDEGKNSINLRVDIDVEARLTLGDSQSFPFWVYANCNVQVSSPSSSGLGKHIVKDCTVN